MANPFFSRLVSIFNPGVANISNPIAQRLIALSLSKIAALKNERGGINMRKNLQGLYK